MDVAAGSLNPPGAAVSWLMETGFGLRSQSLRCTKQVQRGSIVTLWLVYQRISYWTMHFFQEIAEVESVCFCVSQTLQWGLIWQWENTTASFVNIRRQVRTVFSSVCTYKNPLSLSKECVSVGLCTCANPTGPVFYAELHFIPCCFLFKSCCPCLHLCAHILIKNKYVLISGKA